MFRSLSLVLCLLSGVFAAPNVHADVVARVLATKDSAVVKRGSQQLKAVKNFALETGDKILTNASGEVQILFADRTRILVGPASEFHVQNVKMTSKNKARKFAVRALSGSFRFLSGDSKKQAYKIKTPSVTMGIRGTEFDFVVPTRSQTRVVAFSGQVQVCNRRNSCSYITGGCDLTTVVRSKFYNPKTNADRLTLLATEFPLVADQRRYNRDFRVNTDECGGVQEAVNAVRSRTTATPKAVEVERPAVATQSDAEIRSDRGSAPAPEPDYDESADEN